MILDITNNSDHNFVLDGECFSAGSIKSDKPVRIAATSNTRIELGTTVEGISGLLWWVDDAEHSVNLSIAVTKPRVSKSTFSCFAGALPANLKTELGSSPALVIGTSIKAKDSSCEWQGTADGVAVTIFTDLSKFMPPTAADYAAAAAAEKAAAAAEPGFDPPARGADERLPLKEKEGADMEAFLAQTRPKDGTDGVTRGLKTAGAGVAGGIGLAIAAPVAGAKKGGALGFAKGLGAGIVGGAALGIGGMMGGAAQVGRGMMQVPAAYRARREEKVWDQELGQWVDVDLCAQELQAAAQEAEEEGHAGTAAAAGGGTRSVKETEYYELLLVSPSASPSEVKKAYYKEARQCHPDKNPGDAAATAKFQKLSQVYQVLSDPDSRKKYDREGASGVEEQAGSQQMDPTAFFALLFGSEKFLPWTGELHVAMQADHFVKAQSKEEEDGEMPTPDGASDAEALKRRQFRREVHCAVHLRDKLDRWVYRREPEGFVEQMRLEAHELSSAQFGPELLITLGQIYQVRAEIYLANELAGRWSVSKRAAAARHSALHLQHGFRFYKNAAASALEAKKVYQTANKQVKDGDDEEAAAAQAAQAKEVESVIEGALPGFLQTAWSYVVRDVDATAKLVGRKLLQDKSVPWQVRVRRAQALQCLGQIFVEVGTAASSSADGASKAAASDDVKDALHEALAGAMRDKK